MYLRILPPDGQVTVSAPSYVTNAELSNFLLSKLPDIYMRQERMRSQPRQTERTYVSGEAHYLWGKPYRLQVVYAGTRASVTKRASKLVMTVPQGYTVEQRERVMTEWYRGELRRVLQSATRRCMQTTGIEADDFRIKNMKTRWGTCNIPQRRIWVNLQLVKKHLNVSITRSSTNWSTWLKQTTPTDFMSGWKSTALLGEKLKRR